MNEIDCSKCGSTWVYDFRDGRYVLKRGRKHTGCNACKGKK